MNREVPSKFLCFGIRLSSQIALSTEAGYPLAAIGVFSLYTPMRVHSLRRGPLIIIIRKMADKNELFKMKSGKGHLTLSGCEWLSQARYAKAYSLADEKFNGGFLG